MDFSLSQGLRMAVTLVVIFVILIAFGNFLEATNSESEDKTIEDSMFNGDNINQSIAGRKEPTLEVANIYLKVGDTTLMDDEALRKHLKTYVTAKDCNGVDISSSTEVFGKLDINKVGKYPIRFVVTDSAGLKTSYIKYVIVN